MVGFWLRNEGYIINMWVKSSGNNLIIIAEIIGFREGNKEVIRLRFIILNIEWDNKCVIKFFIYE